MPDGKTDRRAKREEAVRDFNNLAHEYGVDAIRARPDAAEVVDLYTALLQVVPAQFEGDLTAARAKWVNFGGGGEFPEAADPAQDDDLEPPGDPGATTTVPGHQEEPKHPFFPPGGLPPFLPPRRLASLPPSTGPGLAAPVN